MIEGQCQRLPVQPYRGSDCNGPGTDSTRLLCHLGRFKLPQAECWRGRSLLGRRRAVSRGLKQPYPNHLMNAPRKPFPDLIPEDPHIFQQKNVLNSARRAVTLECGFVPSVLELGDETGRDPDLRIRPPEQSAYSSSGTPSSVRSWIEFIATQ